MFRTTSHFSSSFQLRNEVSLRGPPTVGLVSGILDHAYQCGWSGTVFARPLRIDNRHSEMKEKAEGGLNNRHHRAHHKACPLSRPRLTTALILSSTPGSALSTHSTSSRTPGFITSATPSRIPSKTSVTRSFQDDIHSSAIPSHCALPIPSPGFDPPQGIQCVFTRHNASTFSYRLTSDAALVDAVGLCQVNCIELQGFCGQFLVTYDDPAFPGKSTCEM